MGYISEFYNINDTIKYKLEIIISGDTSVNEITLSDTPFVVEYNTPEIIYEPFKLSDASINILSNTFLFDLYHSEAQKVKVIFTDTTNNIVKWVGYVEPTMYTQGFNDEFENIEVNAIDALSTLQYFDYEFNNRSYPQILNFETIIINCIKKCNAYKEIFLSDTLQVQLLELNNMFKEVYISEQNFVDADGNKIKYKDVLEYILKYLNLTITTEGEKVYILDYDGLKNGYYNYYKLTTSNNWTTYTSSTSTLNNSYTIDENSITKNTNSIELDKTYNKISVKSNQYYVDNFIYDLFDEDSITPIENAPFNETIIEKTLNVQIDEKTVNKTYLFEFYENNKYDYNYYTLDWNNSTWISTTPNTNFFDFYNDDDVVYNIGASTVKIAEYTTNQIPSKLDFTEYILLHTLNVENSAIRNFELIKTKVNTIPPNSYFGGTKYILITGEMMHTDRFETYPVANYEKYDKQNFTSNDLYMKCKLRIGNKYWDGLDWYEHDAYFYLFFDKEDKTFWINNWFKVKNNVVYDNEINEDGYAIPITQSDELSGDVYFSICKAHVVSDTYPQNNTWLKDFKVEIKYKSDKKNDYVHENIIDDDYVNELSDIDLKVNSQFTDDSAYALSYSIPCIKPVGYSSIINNLYNIKDRVFNEMQHQEYNIINRYVNQYKDARIKFDLNIKNVIHNYTIIYIDGIQFLNKKFVVTGQIIDYLNNSTNVKLIEKN